MKNKLKNKSKDEFRHFRTKLYGRAVGLLAIACVIIIILYYIILKGHFADMLVSFMNDTFFRESHSGYVVYVELFRNNKELIFLIAVLFIFFLLMTMYIRSFVKYFKGINRGIDSLLETGSDSVDLPFELAPVEDKINSVKNTLIQQRNEIQTMEQRKNDLIMYLAHDLKTPLASVIGYLSLLRDEEQISAQLREKYLSITLDKAERLEDLINEFFEITRFNLSNITLQYGRIDLIRLLEQLIYDFTPMLQEKKLTCRLQAMDELIIKCDADKIQRVFDNLLRNAVLYSFENTEIEITVTQENGSVAITFVNCGDTIPAEKLDRIFEQFYRLDSSRSTKSGAAGLGLAIAKQIVELHGGTIIAYSEQEKIKFTVTLPIS